MHEAQVMLMNINTVCTVTDSRQRLLTEKKQSGLCNLRPNDDTLYA